MHYAYIIRSVTYPDKLYYGSIADLKSVLKSIMSEEIHRIIRIGHGHYSGMEGFHAKKQLRNSRNTSRPPLEKHLHAKDYFDTVSF